MSGPWEQFAGGSTPPAAPETAEPGPWEQFKPAPAPEAAPRTGAAAIPTEAEAAGKPYTPPAAPAAAPPAPPTFADKVTGAVEAGLNLATGFVGSMLGSVTGTAQSVAQGVEATAGAVGRKLQGLPPQELPARPSLEQLQAEHSQGITGALKRVVSGPMNLHEEQTPDTELGQQYTEAAQPVVENLMAAAPLHGTMGPAGAGGALKQAAGDVRRAYVAPVANAAAESAAGGVGKVARKALGVDPELAKVAQVAGDLKYPIDVRPDQVVSNAKFTKLAGQAAADVPLSNSKIESNRVAYTRNLIDMLNPEETADRLTPETFSKAMDRSGQGIGEILEKTPVPLDTGLRDGLDRLRGEADKFATDNDKRILSNYIDEVRNKADDQGVIDGKALKELNSEIGARARTEVDNDLGRRLNDLQDVIQDAVERHVDPADVAPLKDYRRQYAYGKMVEPLVAKTIDGQVSPAALMARVTATKRGKHFMARSMGGPIGDLAKVGQLIKEPGSSGTAERSLVYGAIKDVGKTAAAAAGGYPAAFAYNTLGPKLTRAMVGKRPKKAPPEPPPEPTTSPGAAPEGGGGGPAPAPSPLGDLTPDWSTTPGAGGGPPRGEHVPGLHRAVDEPAPTGHRKAAKLEIPAVPGRPDLPDTLISGAPAETAATARSGAAMHEPGAQEAIRRGREEPPEGGGGGPAPAPTPRGPAGPALAEVERLRAENKSPVVQKVLAEHEKALRAEEAKREAKSKNEADAAELEKAARATTDSALQARLLKQADKLRAAEPIPVGEVKEGQPPIKTEKPGKIPAGKATEIEAERVEPAPEVIPTGETYELPPEQEAKWRDEFRLGDQDAARARDVARALDHDDKAVHAAVRQHENNPRAFDREIARINEEARHADEGKQAARSSAGTEAAGTPGGRDRAAPVRAGEGAGDRATPVREAEGQPGSAAAAVRAAAEQPGTERAAAPAAGRGGVEPAGRQGPAVEAARRMGVEIREVPSGFEAWKDGKKVGYLRDNLERGQAEQLGENANVDIVKVDKDQAGTGIGRALYEAFNEKHGGRILPSGKTEPSAWALWKRNYPAKVDEFVKAEAARIRDGADPGLVARNITDADVRARVLTEAERGTDTQPHNQPGAVRQKAGAKELPSEPPEEVFSEGKAAQEPDQNRVGSTEERRGSVETRPAGSAEALETALRSKFGDKLIQGLKDQGVLRFALAEDEGMVGDRGGVRAVLRQGGPRPNAATLYFDRLSAQDAPGVLMHELGEHFGIVRVLGPKRYNVMLDELRGLRNTPEVREAWDVVKRNYIGEDTASKLVEGEPQFLREVAAHLVENHPDLPFVRRLINEIRAFFYENFGTTMGNRVDANLIRGLAASALRRAAAGELPKMRQGVTPFVAPRARPSPNGALRPVQ